ncbi:DUF3572 domain-containing protein [Mycoplana sp. MJR14]|jgi:hypothetical protein|uniref:DUF3572 domain-containing protein n=1 Tax=Mycoplana sp. MJR14 TaxID=3032583 RepID=UPI000DD5EC1E|nr:DUF3572 domain-containing protein [Mycoplana sp. MJR14]MDF1634818.1 DUF3572 domain-containing protein [Mycoplana sp. MJR14]
MQSQKDTSAQEAETTAIAVLAWLAGEPELLSRFLSLTGVDPAGLREAAGNRGFLAGLLDFLMGHEPTLIAFCEATNRKPEQVVRAHALMSGAGSGADWP